MNYLRNLVAYLIDADVKIDVLEEIESDARSAIILRDGYNTFTITAGGSGGMTVYGLARKEYGAFPKLAVIGFRYDEASGQLRRPA